MTSINWLPTRAIGSGLKTSIATNANGPLAGNRCEVFIAFLTAYHGRIRDSLSQYPKAHLHYRANIISGALSCKYFFPLGVLLMLGEANGIIDMLEESWERLSVVPRRWVQYKSRTHYCHN